eukprot:s345_g5.t1
MLRIIQRRLQPSSTHELAIISISSISSLSFFVPVTACHPVTHGAGRGIVDRIHFFHVHRRSLRASPLGAEEETSSVLRRMAKNCKDQPMGLAQ